MRKSKSVCLSLPPTLIEELQRRALGESFTRLYWVSYLDLVREAVAEKYGNAETVKGKPRKGKQ